MGSVENNENSIQSEKLSQCREPDIQDCPLGDLNSVLRLLISRSGVQEKIRIKNVKRVEKLIEELISSGSEELQIITDFDATLSCYHADGKKCSTSYGIFSNQNFFPADVKARADELFQHYHPIEIDSTISAEEKSRAMAEWYEKKHANYLSSSVKIKSTDVSALAKTAHIVLRDGSPNILKKAHLADIPTLVFSAGSGDAVVEVLKRKEVYTSNVKVIANFMLFDEVSSELIGFQRPIVHPGNKNEAALHDNHSQYFESLKNRRNVILLGDTIGDTNMATGIPNPKAVLKIGYLNFNFEEQLETFKDAFDIVFIDDQSVHFVDTLLDLILKS